MNRTQKTARFNLIVMSIATLEMYGWRDKDHE